MKLYRIKKSKIDNKGRGLYATRDIKAGTKIINYIGKIITNRKVDESDKFDNKKPIYLFTLNKKYTLDGDFHWNTAGLINHSCDNNCDYEGKGLKVWVSAIKNIKKGEEFTCDYGFSYDEDYKQFSLKKVPVEVLVEHIKLFFLISLHFQIFSMTIFFLQRISNNQPLNEPVVVKKIGI